MKLKVYPGTENHLKTNLFHINIHYHLRLGSPPLHRQFFIKISKNRDRIQAHCNDHGNSFRFCMSPMVFI